LEGTVYYPSVWVPGLTRLADYGILLSNGDSLNVAGTGVLLVSAILQAPSRLSVLLLVHERGYISEDKSMSKQPFLYVCVCVCVCPCVSLCVSVCLLNLTLRMARVQSKWDCPVGIFCLTNGICDSQIVLCELGLWSSFGFVVK